MSDKTSQEEFEELAFRHIHRDCIENLLSWLRTTDFYEAPASSKYHCSYPGGLVEHSINVYKMLCSSPYLSSINEDSKAICALFHDICKVDYYKQTTRNVKDEVTGKWDKEPYFAVEEKFIYGHGEKSVYLLSKYLELTDEEALAIRWHMGGWDKSASVMGSVADTSPLITELHVADLRATHLLEVPELWPIIARRNND